VIYYHDILYLILSLPTSGVSHITLSLLMGHTQHDENISLGPLIHPPIKAAAASFTIGHWRLRIRSTVWPQISQVAKATSGFWSPHKSK
jgi:hypothetical protein